MKNQHLIHHGDLVAEFFHAASFELAVLTRAEFRGERLQLLMALVKANHALAYLPDLALQDPELVRVAITDCPYTCEETCSLLWRPAVASGWQNKIVSALTAH